MHWLVSSPRRFFLGPLLLLLALDAGRSIYARHGYRHPARAFSGQPYDTDFPWPPERAAAEDAPPGRRLYVRYCSACHGLRGDGLGPAAGNMLPRPRDLRGGKFKYQSTAPGELPSDEDLRRVIADGLPASAMPYFSDILDPIQIAALVGYVKELGGKGFEAARQPLVVPPRAPPDDAARHRGQQLFVEHCAGCHGRDGRQRGKLIPEDTSDWGARDLTAPWTFRGGHSPAELYLRVSDGLGQPQKMPRFAELLTPAQRWDVVAFVESLARPAPWESAGALQGLGQTSDPTRRGEYLTRSLMCTYCHTESVVPMNYNNERYLGGGAATRAYPDGTVISPNLTPDRDTGIGKWSEADIARALRRGRTPSRSLDLGFKQWFFYQYSDEDAHAIARYLKSVPPRRHRIPPPLRYGVVETVWRKLGRLPLITPTELKIPVPTGPFGEEAPSWLPWDWPQRLLIGAQWSVLALALLGWTVLAFQRRGWRRPTSANRRLLLGLTGIGTLFALGGAIYKLYALVPRNAMIGFIDRNLYRPPAQALPVDERRLVERGRYLYKVSCVLCHQIDGGGGDRMSDPYAGSFTVRNISSDPELGIGRWSDREVARALRSGIRPDGRVMFWGFMPWDMFSNLDEEDVRSLVAYMRRLPPSKKTGPPPELPTRDHPPEITWQVDMERILERVRAIFGSSK